MSSEAVFTVLVAAVALQRLAEVVLSQRNTAWLLARGGVETGQRHYPAMVALHTAFLLGVLVEVWVRRPDPVAALTVVALLALVVGQAVRWWCVAALGRRWTTRVVVLPGTPRVRSGPYRWLAHPNYAVVALEGLALPLVHAAWWTALLFTVANAVFLTVRIRAEDRALDGAEAVGGVGGPGALRAIAPDSAVTDRFHSPGRRGCAEGAAR